MRSSSRIDVGIVCVTFAVLALTISPAASQTNLEQAPRTAGRLDDSFAGTRLRVTSPPDKNGRATFSIESVSGSGGAAATFDLENLSAVVSLTVYGTKRSIIMVRETTSLQTKALVIELPVGRIVESFALDNPIELRSAGLLLYQPERRSIVTYAFDVRTLDRRIVSDAERAAILLQYGGSFHRLSALNTIEANRDWWSNEGVRHVLATELSRAVAEDAAVASSRARGIAQSIDRESERSTYYDSLVRLIGRLRDQRFLQTLVLADTWSASGALTGLGLPAVPAILAVLQRPTAPGVSEHYVEGLLRALKIIGTTNPEVWGYPQTIAILQRMLSTPPNWRALSEAINVVVEMDEDALFGRVRQLADDAELVRRMIGGDPRALAEVSEALRLASSRRWTQP